MPLDEPRQSSEGADLSHRSYLDTSAPSTWAFLDAVIQNAGKTAVLPPDGSGRPFAFGPWVIVAARGSKAEADLAARIRMVWKTDLFLTVEGSSRYAAATIKSNWTQLEDGPGLRIAIVPEAKDLSHKRR